MGSSHTLIQLILYKTLGAYHAFTRKTKKFWLENEMVHAIPLEKFQK